MRYDGYDAGLAFYLHTFGGMAAFQRTATHDYHGTPDTQGARGRLRIFKVVQAETAMQPKQISRTPEGSALLNSGHVIPRIGLGTWKSESLSLRSLRKAK